MQGYGYPGGPAHQAPPGQGHPPQQLQQHPQQAPATGMGRLVVHTEFFPLMWILFFVSTGVEVNGYAQKRPWGFTEVDLPAGVHYLRVYFNYMFGPAGIAMRQVQIHPGYVTRLNYSPPWLVFLSGKLQEFPPVPIQQLPPAGGVHPGRPL